jgi:archaeosine-15-forming tRNA-guanine transglycosylase
MGFRAITYSTHAVPFRHMSEFLMGHTFQESKMIDDETAENKDRKYRVRQIVAEGDGNNIFDMREVIGTVMLGIFSTILLVALLRSEQRYRELLRELAELRLK